MELQVLNKVGRIEWNIDEIRQNVTKYIAEFKDLVVTEDNLKDMEKTQKVLATIRRQVDKFRKETKADYEKPLKAFEMEIKSIQDIIADAEIPLSDQLKKYEQQRVNAKRMELQALGAEIAVQVGLREENLFDFVIKPEWTNRTAAKGKVTTEVVAEIERLKREQDLKDQALQMEQLRQQQIEMLCQTSSELFGLNTPITSQDCAYATKNAQLTDLPDIVKEVAKKRADVEQRMMATVAPVIQKESPAPKKVNEAPKEKIFKVHIDIDNLPESRLAYLQEQLSDLVIEIWYEDPEVKDHGRKYAAL